MLKISYSWTMWKRQCTLAIISKSWFVIPSRQLWSDIVIRPSVCGWRVSGNVGPSSRFALWARKDNRFWLVVFTLWIQIVDDNRRNRIDIGLYGQRSRSILAVCVPSNQIDLFIIWMYLTIVDHLSSLTQCYKRIIHCNKSKSALCWTSSIYFSIGKCLENTVAFKSRWNMKWNRKGDNSTTHTIDPLNSDFKPSYANCWWWEEETYWYLVMRSNFKVNNGILCIKLRFRLQSHTVLKISKLTLLILGQGSRVKGQAQLSLCV